MPGCISLIVTRFRWIECQLETLRGCRNPEDVEKALKTLPKDLDITYDRILDNIVDENDRERAKCVLQLMAVACRPLTIEEVNEALIVDFEGEIINHKRKMWDPSVILEICSSLIELAGCVFN